MDDPIKAAEALLTFFEHIPGDMRHSRFTGYLEHLRWRLRLNYGPPDEENLEYLEGVVRRMYTELLHSPLVIHEPGQPLPQTPGDRGGCPR